MKPEAIARAYLACIELEERIRNESPELAEEVGPLRAELHALLMQALREANIPFVDRADAAHIAVDLVNGIAH
jgi:hypothetical protein